MAMRPGDRPADLTVRLSRRHLMIGWIGLVVFLTLGIVLESLHGLKAGYYLDTRNVTRRLMWTLAHAHGTLFSLVNIVFALCLSRLTAPRERRLRLASAGLGGALALMPLGFFLGGLKLYGGDPGPGILLVPLGAVLLLVGAGAFALEMFRSWAGGQGSLDTAREHSDLGTKEARPAKRPKT